MSSTVQPPRLFVNRRRLDVAAAAGRKLVRRVLVGGDRFDCMYVHIIKIQV